MPTCVNRRELLKSLGWGCLAIAPGGATASVMPAWAEAAAAQGNPPRAGIPRIMFARAPLQNGIVPHSGETSMDLYHNHPHFEREEIVQPDDIRLQTRLTMLNHKEKLDWMGLDWRHVVKLTRYQKSFGDSQQVEEVLASYFRDTWPPMAVYEINGLSSPQAGIEIDMWVVPEPGSERYAATPGPVEGISVVLPRPEMPKTGYAPALMIGRDMDLIFISGVSPYPWDVDPWSPGAFKLPSDDAGLAKMATDNLDQVVQAAGITWRHLIFRVTYAAPGGGRIDFGARQGDHQACSTSLRVTDTGIPGVDVLYQMTAAAPRRNQPSQGPIPGVEPLLVRPGMSLAPAIRVSSDLDLIYFSGITAYPMDVDPWNPGSFRLPQDSAAQEKMLADNVERTLKSAGITWQNIVLLARTGEDAGLSSMTERMGNWRPCRTTRAVPSGVPGAKVMCDITAVAPHQA